MVRPWSAMARVIAWRIHHVAYVENLKPLRVVELLHRPHEPEVPLLDEVEEREPSVAVTLGDRHDEAQVGLDERVLRLLAGEHRGTKLGAARAWLRDSSGSTSCSAASFPASMRIASSTSLLASSSGTLPISFR